MGGCSNLICSAEDYAREYLNGLGYDTKFYDGFDYGTAFVATLGDETCFVDLEITADGHLLMERHAMGERFLDYVKYMCDGQPLEKRVSLMVVVVCLDPDCMSFDGCIQERVPVNW